MPSLQKVIDAIDMIDKQHLDIRTITMGISLLDCASEDAGHCCEKIYDKICHKAENLVKTGESIEREFGIPIVNKRISVTPMALVAGSCRTEDYVPFALTMDKAAKACGVNFMAASPRSCRRALQRAMKSCCAQFRRRWRRRISCVRASTSVRRRPVSIWTPWRGWEESSRRRRI